MARRWARGPLLLACAFRCGVSGPGDARSRTPPRTAAAMPSYCRGAGHVPGSGAVCHSPQRTPLAHPSSCSFSIVCCRNGFRSGGVRAGLQPTPIGGGPRRDSGFAQWCRQLCRHRHAGGLGAPAPPCSAGGVAGSDRVLLTGCSSRMRAGVVPV